MSDPRDPFEDRLARGLDDLAAEVHAPDDLARRASVRRRARQRRMAAVLAIPLLAAAAAVILVAATNGGHDRPRVVRTIDETTTTESTTASSSTSTTMAVIPDMTPTTSTPADPTPEPRCAEATGTPRSLPDDWAKWWTTKPAQDEPMTVRACVDDATPREGQTITLTITASDPDDTIPDSDCGAEVHWDDSRWSCHDVLLAPPAEPQPLPTASPGHLERAVAHAYTTEGAQVVHVTVYSGDSTGRDPYSSYATVDLPIDVHR